MEIVLLWLDDLDDLVFSGALAWERLRRVCLQFGLTASLGLAACQLFANAAAWTPPLAGVAVSSVSVWAAGALYVFVRRLEARSGHLLA
jgi:hypothetical protein